jgi:hypothetical protein
MEVANDTGGTADGNERCIDAHATEAAVDQYCGALAATCSVTALAQGKLLTTRSVAMIVMRR